MSKITTTTTRSSGQKGPSQPKSGAAKTVTTVKETRSRPKSGRSRRRNRNRNRQSSGSSVPVAFPASFPPQFLTKGRGSKHKEWGDGDRVTGRSILGTVQLSASSTRTFVPTIQHYTNVLTGPWYDAYTVWAGYYSFIPLIWALIPELVPRLADMSNLYGRYAFRKIKITYHPVGPTSALEGINFSLSHAVSKPFNWNDLGQTVNGIVQDDNISSGAVWQPATLSAKDYNGDKTWPTSLPDFYLDASILTINSLNGRLSPGDLSNVAENFYQFYMGSCTPAGLASASTRFQGYVFIDYVVDFYVPQAGGAINIPFIIYGDLTAAASDRDESSIRRGDRSLIRRSQRPIPRPDPIDTKRSSSLEKKRIVTSYRDSVGTKQPVTPVPKEPEMKSIGRVPAKSSLDTSKPTVEPKFQQSLLPSVDPDDAYELEQSLSLMGDLGG